MERQDKIAAGNSGLAKGGFPSPIKKILLKFGLSAPSWV